MRKKGVFRICVFVLLLPMMFLHLIIPAQAKGNIKIVIDPGHGGENLGAEYNNCVEKEATLKVAFALRDELEKYEGVDVYLTRETDCDLSIEERAKYANDKDADMLISLHFNMSEEHTLSGSEMWLPSDTYLYNKAFQFANTECQLLEDYGIPKRGIFVRLNSQNEDYYGIPRYCSKYGIPSVILEHCYFDMESEYHFYDTDAALNRLGKLDATAIAMSFRLASSQLGVDYSDYKTADIALPNTVVEEDITAPRNVRIDLNDYDEETNILEVYVEAYDDESSIGSFSYSTDGGHTYSERFDFDGLQNTVVSMQASPQANFQLKFRVFNSYGLESVSNKIDVTEELWPQLQEEFIRNEEQENITEENLQVLIDENVSPSEKTMYTISADEMKMRRTTGWTVFVGTIIGIFVVAGLSFYNYKMKKENYNIK